MARRFERAQRRAEAAMGRAIAIARAEINPAPPANSKDPVFSTEQERAKRAIEEFQKVVAKYGDPYRSEAQLFIARNLLVTEPERGVAELQNLSTGSGDVAVLAKFALAQKKEADGKLDEAAAIEVRGLVGDLGRSNVRGPVDQHRVQGRGYLQYKGAWVKFQSAAGTPR